MDQAERERELSKPTSDEMVANSKAENTNNPSVEESRKETFNKVEKEEDVTSAVVTTSPFANVFLSNNMEAAQSRQAEALVTPVVNEANREEEAIVSRVLAGNTEAFAELIDRYKVAVYNLCARMLHDPSEAEDASQEVFLRTYNQLATYQPGRRFSTWILSIASHYCIDLLRRRRPIVDIDSIAFWKQRSDRLIQEARRNK